MLNMMIVAVPLTMYMLWVHHWIIYLAGRVDYLEEIVDSIMDDTESIHEDT